MGPRSPPPRRSSGRPVGGSGRIGCTPSSPHCSTGSCTAANSASLRRWTTSSGRPVGRLWPGCSSPARAQYPRRGTTITRPSTWLKQHIPIRTFADWDDARPGSCQVDLVAHYGGSTEGFYLHTLCDVDVATSWVELQALGGKGHYRVAAGVQAVRQRLRVTLAGLDCDKTYSNLEIPRFP
jgi:hypothetical protein